MARFLVARSALLLWCAIAAALTTSLTCSAHQSDNESRQPIYQLQQQKQSASMQRDHLLTSSIASSLDNREKDIASTASQSRIKSHEGVSRTDAIKTASVRFSNYVSPVSARCYLYNEFTGTTIDFGAVEEKGKSPVQEVPVNPNVQADNVWMVIVNVGTNYSADELLYINSSSPVVSKVLYTVFVYGNVSHDVHMWVNTNETKKQPLEIDQALLNVRNKELNPVDLYQQSSRCGEKCNFTYMGTVLPGEMIGFPINARFSLKFNINYTNEPNELVCSISNYLHFHEGGVYNLTAEVIVNNHSCPHHMNSSGDGMTYFPLLYAAVVILALTLCFVSAGCIYKVVLNRGWLHYLHINAIDRRIARDLGEPKHTSTNYGSTGPETPPSVVSPTEADPLIKGNSAAGLSGLTTAGDLLVQGTADSLKVVTRKRLKSLDAFRG